MIGAASKYIFTHFILIQQAMQWICEHVGVIRVAHVLMPFVCNFVQHCIELFWKTWAVVFVWVSQHQVDTYIYTISIDIDKYTGYWLHNLNKQIWSEPLRNCIAGRSDIKSRLKFCAVWTKSTQCLAVFLGTKLKHTYTNIRDNLFRGKIHFQRSR